MAYNSRTCSHYGLIATAFPFPNCLLRRRDKSLPTLECSRKWWSSVAKSSKKKPPNLYATGGTRNLLKWGGGGTGADLPWRCCRGGGAGRPLLQEAAHRGRRVKAFPPAPALPAPPPLQHNHAVPPPSNFNKLRSPPIPYSIWWQELGVRHVYDWGGWNGCRLGRRGGRVQQHCRIVDGFCFPLLLKNVNFFQII